MESYDVIIIGAGPIGLATGIEAQKRNLRYLIIEKGCLVNSIYHYPANMTFFSTSDKIEIGGVPFVSHGPKPTRREALEYYRRVKELWQLPVRTYERVEQIRLAGAGYELETSKGRYRSTAVVVATGFFDHPNLMGVPGEDLPKVRHYYDEPHPYIDQRVLVVGAANSAVDAALETWRKGAQVTMVIRQPEISHRVKYWVRPDIDNRIKEGSIKAYFSSQIAEIRPEAVDVQTPEGLVTVPNDWVLAMTGFRPDYAWMERMGIAVSDDPLRIPQRDEQTFETNLPNVYLAGTICGGMNTNKWFIENSVEHGSTVMDQIQARLRG
ncbi:MAG: YpdA family putative bacillithiol disulfide reductase [Bacteroidetes bacterium]|nr:MAG: YpdA family putative bacillithiol disulfide reductase [Bacteroidota bacterium]